MSAAEASEQYLQLVKTSSSDMDGKDVLDEMKKIVSTLDYESDREKFLEDMSKVCYFMTACCVKKEVSMLDVMSHFVENSQ